MDWPPLLCDIRAPHPRETFVIQLPPTHIEDLALSRESGPFRAVLCLSSCSLKDLTAASAGFLHPEESKRLEGAAAERWRENFLRGRYCAKAALTRYLGAGVPTEILISNGVFGQPLVHGAGDGHAQISISHTSGWGAALAFDEAHPMAIDLEVLNPRRQDAIRSEVSRREIEAISATRLPPTMHLTVLWTIKESLSKVLRCGLMTPFATYEIEASRDEGDVIVTTFTKFAQYKALSFVIGDRACSITLPRKTEVKLDLRSWKM